MKIAIVNGPNLNLVGNREQEIYGNQSLVTYLEELNTKTQHDLVFFQSNIEGEIIDFLQTNSCDGILINAGAYTHTSIAIRDCISAIKTPVVEVHISNITNRESFRHTSFITPVCVGCVFGFGLKSYAIALNYFE